MSVPKPISRKIVDLAGRRFGRLLVVEFAGRDKNSKSKWSCLCDCGRVKVIPAKQLGGGNTNSCGCIVLERLAILSQTTNRKHGRTKTPEYRVWNDLRRRCKDPRCRGFSRYGGRGIRVCKGYDLSFENFLADMGDRPSTSHSVDRKENNAHYSCGKCPECIANGWTMNVRWATVREQSLNTSRSLTYTFEGRTLGLVEWSEERGIPYMVLFYRLKKGWTPEDALNKPFQPPRSTVKRARKHPTS